MESPLSQEAIARVCHEVNRGYCEGINDHTQVPWEDAPEWQRESALKGVALHQEAHLRGESVPPSASHEAWLAEKVATGWKYGPVKDAKKKEHPCCVPFEELFFEQQIKNHLFGAVVRALLTSK